MAQEDGVAMLANGVNTLTGYIVREIDETENAGDPTRIADESGDVVTTISGFGIEFTHRIALSAKSGTATPAIGDIITYTSHTHGALTKFRVNGIESAERQTQEVQWILNGFSWPAITPS